MTVHVGSRTGPLISSTAVAELRPLPAGPRLPRAIAGVYAVALLLLGTRWSSYLGRAPLFFTDVLLLGALIHWSVQRLVVGRPLALPTKSRLRPLVILTLLGISLWLVAGETHGFTTLRDAAPYAYAGVALLAASATRMANAQARERTLRILRAALGLHAAWYIIVTVVAPTLPASLPTLSAELDIHVLTVRNDVDASLVGVLAALLLTGLLRGGPRGVLRLVGFGACWTAVLLNESRAGLLSAVLVNLIAFVLAVRQPTAQRRFSRRHVALVMVPVILSVGLILLPSTPIGSRLNATFGRTDSAVSASAVGTTRARGNAWGAVLSWVAEDASRLSVGVGFGPNFMAESGASLRLVGTEAEGATLPRSPHNYWLGTLARTGLVGLALVLGIVACFGSAAVSLRRRIADEDFLLLVFLVPLAMVIPASLGVVLESPFGAVPFFWCIGALVSVARAPLQSATPTSAKRRRPSAVGGHGC